MPPMTGPAIHAELAAIKSVGEADKYYAIVPDLGSSGSGLIGVGSPVVVDVYGAVGKPARK